MGSSKYYQLIASLPHLPRFDRAESLPISRERLLQRLNMLEPEDYKKAEQAAEFLAWRRQPVERTHAQMIEIYNKGLNLFTSPMLKEMFEAPVNQRTIVAALRRKQRGLPPPTLGEPWGVGSLVEPITRNWDDPVFKLASRFPWIAQAKRLLERGDSLQLESLLFKLIWDKLDQMVFKNYFGFEAVIAYLMKWDMIEQWLSYKKESAHNRFKELISGVVNEYEQRAKPLNVS